MGNIVKCKRPGCTGKIEDGICEDCGKAPLGQKILTNAEKLQIEGSSGPGSAVLNQGFATGTVGSARTGSRRQSSRSSHGSTNRRQALGGGLVSLPPQPSQDPLKLVMANPEVPERKRYCPACEAKVNRTKGFCVKCGVEYNFEPSLKAGDLINNKFEIKGPIAFGGLGWIYLGWDTVLSRWVVLKGLLNAKDEASAAAAVAERQFLAAVKHPKIVGIYDFIQNASEGYIVMEYVGGRTIQDMIKEKNILPVEEAIAYILGILPAFGYLHNNGFVYCDFKPDNFMLENDDVKLIDMGGVRKINDPNGDIYGTKGFMAPEASDDPVEVSDLYTLGRTLAVMLMNFKHQGQYENSLPLPSEQPILAQYDSLYRFLLRATHQNPDQRFQSADEMFDQLYGVLREIVALNSTPKPAESKVFTYDNLLDSEDSYGTTTVDIAYLPTLKIDVKDVAANDLLRLSSVVNSEKRISLLETLANKYKERSVEARLRLVDALITAGSRNKINIEKTAFFAKTTKILTQIYNEDNFDWRVHWYLGKSYLAQKNKEAKNEFGMVYFEMPGELAPKLAIAFAEEVMGNKIEAIDFYNRVAKVDPTYTTACFGLARCYQEISDTTEAVNALNRIPSNHSLYTQSRIASVKLLMQNEKQLNQSIIEQAAQTIEAISVEGGILHQLSAKLLCCVISLITKGSMIESANDKLLGCNMIVNDLRKQAENEYRKSARYAVNAEEKILLVNLANTVRPLTLF